MSLEHSSLKLNPLAMKVQDCRTGWWCPLFASVVESTPPHSQGWWLGHNLMVVAGGFDVANADLYDVITLQAADAL